MINAGISENMGDILNYPSNYDDQRAQEVHFSDGKPYKAGNNSKLSETRSQSMYPSAELSTNTFPKARELAEALCDMCVMEG